MKKAFTYGFSLLLVAVFGVTSVGFTFKKMVCLSSGNTKVSIGEVKCCCPEIPNGTTAIDVKCCEYSTIDLRLKLPAITKVSVVKQIQVKVFSFAKAIIHRSGFAAITRSFIFYGDLPPPEPGFSLLKRIRVLRL